MEPSSSSNTKRKKLNESKEAAIEPEFSGPQRKIELKFSERKKKVNNNCNENLIESSSNMCHQCKQDRGRVVRCSKCKSRRYCVHCITKWYPMMSEKDFELACPVCKQSCNCINCLRLEDPLMATSRWNLEVIPNTDHISEIAKHMLKTILPFMRQIHKEQKMEKMREAKIQGVSLLQLKVESIYHLDERVYCGNCKTYIPDLHRSCTHCSYKLCLTCCREVCDGCLQGVQKEEIMQFLVPGEEYLHRAGKYTATLKEGKTLGNDNKCEDHVKLTYEWKLDENENIPCPPKDMGGCGNGILALKHILSEDCISSLFRRANELFEQHNLRDMPETPMQWCTCPNSCDNSGGNVRRAASRENSNDNYLYSPTAVNIKDADLKHFQSHFCKGEPVIVNNVLETTCGLSWEPLVIGRAFRQIRSKKHPPLKNVSAINCLDWCEVDTTISHFFEGYQKGRFGKDGFPQLLQLTDWPPSTIFNGRVPRHSREFINSLPFKEYTHPYRGQLNLAVTPSDRALKPDLGPKMYISYGVAPELGRGDSVTKLRYNKCDTVNVLMHVQPISLTTSQLDIIKRIKKKHVYQDEFEIYRNEKTRNVNQKQLEGENGEEFENTNGGAVWDIFRRDDISKLKSYLKKHFKEFRHVNCRPVEKVVHPIHDQIFYLSMEHKRRLKAEYGIEPWSFVQQLGDAVFVPAGCPYQVRDIKSCTKVSVGFVSPENVHQCIRLANEIRVLPQHHSAKEDILEVKKLIIYAIKQSVNELEKLNVEHTLYAKDSFQLSKLPNYLSEDSHGFQLLGSDTESMSCTSDEDVDDCSQGPSATEEEAPTEKSRNEDHCGDDTFTSRITSEKQLEIVPCTAGLDQSMHTLSAVCASPNISHRNPMSLPAETVNYFKQLADMLQGDKFDQILPPQIELDEQTICEYEQVLKKGMNGDLRELGKGSRYQEFNQVLTALLSCRRIPSNLYQEFLSLRRDLPSLASRAVEIEKEVTRGILHRDNWSTMKQLEAYMNRYRNCEDNLVKLEQEKAFNFSEIERLLSRNQVIDSEITKFNAEADTLRKASAAESHKLVKLDGVGAVDESTLQQSMADLHKMESEWRKRVALLRF